MTKMKTHRDMGGRSACGNSINPTTGKPTLKSTDKALVDCKMCIKTMPTPAAVINRPRPATCGKCQASLEHSAAFALVLPNGELAWDTEIHQPVHHCEACGLALELAGKTLQHLPTDAQLQSWLQAERQDIGAN